MSQSDCDSVCVKWPRVSLRWGRSVWEKPHYDKARAPLIHWLWSSSGGGMYMESSHRDERKMETHQCTKHIHLSLVGK